MSHGRAEESTTPGLTARGQSARETSTLYSKQPGGGKEVAYLFDGASGDNLWEDRHMGARRLADVASTSGRS
jgi:hypothetical protein